MRLKECIKCEKVVRKDNTTGYCKVCYLEYLEQHHKNNARTRFEKWLETGDLGISVQSTLRGHLRDELLNYYGRHCSICNIGEEWQGMSLTLILDHIDGNASNNSKDNLRFVCPNCDSQLDTYKSKNRGSARVHRN